VGENEMAPIRDPLMDILISILCSSVESYKIGFTDVGKLAEYDKSGVIKFSNVTESMHLLCNSIGGHE
jgi:hypothetical protein